LKEHTVVFASTVCSSEKKKVVLSVNMYGVFELTGEKNGATEKKQTFQQLSRAVEGYLDMLEKLK